jgi:hypothetical protein
VAGRTYDGKCGVLVRFSWTNRYFALCVDFNCDAFSNSLGLITSVCDVALELPERFRLLALPGEPELAHQLLFALTQQALEVAPLV